MSNTTLGLAYRRYKPPFSFGVGPHDRLMHVLLVGQTGTGKSTLMHNMAVQDAQHRHGWCLIDPHGDLAAAVHRSLPASHHYWSLADPACPYGFNPLKHVSAHYRPLVASGLLEALKKQWPDAWGPRMEHLLRYALLALLEQPQADLRDIMKLFTFKGFQRQVSETITDPQVRHFWKYEYPAMNYQSSADGVQSVANKLGAFLAHPQVRTALCEPKEPLRFRSLMDTGQVLVVNLAKGQLGADVANIMGGLITTTVMLAAFSRHSLPACARRPFFLYADEYPSFTTTAFANLLSEARKYGLGLVLAQQHVTQSETEVREAILGNVGTMVVFRVGAMDAPLFEKLLPPFTASDLKNQPNRRAVVRVMYQGEPLRAFSLSTYPPYHAARYRAC